MNQFKPINELKRLAKGQLIGQYGRVIPPLLLNFIIIFSLQTMVISLFSLDTLLSVILYFITTFVIELVGGIFSISQCFIYLKVACNYQVSLSDLFYGFKNAPDKVIKLQFILSLLYNLCTLPSTFVSYQYRSSTDTNSYILSLLLLAIGYFIYFLIYIRFSQIFYLCIDFPNYSIKQLFQTSSNIMKGQKMKYFLLELSFIPLFILAIFSLGLGMLWISPYMYNTETNFYLDLISNRNKNIKANN